MFARAVLKFNISDIPGLPIDANITGINLSIYFLTGDEGDGSGACSLYTISKHWNSSEVTWNNASKTDKWEQLDRDTRYFDSDIQDTVEYVGGGDRIFPCAATTPLANDTNPWENYTITPVMSNYLKNPSSFFGLLIKPYMGNIGRWYASSEYAEINKRPKLIIKYSGTDIISKQVSVNEVNCISILKTQNAAKIFVPKPGEHTVTVFDLKGRELYSFHSIGNKWTDIPNDKFEKGVNILKLTSKDLTIVKNIFNY